MCSDNPRIGFVHLGCTMVLPYAEQVLNQLGADGYTIVADYADADWIVVGACGFTEASICESLTKLAQRSTNRLLIIDYVDSEATTVIDELGGVVIPAGQSSEDVITGVRDHLPPLEKSVVATNSPNVRLTPHHYAYLPLSNRCEHRCGLSTQADSLPIFRSENALVSEAQTLANTGVQELLLVGQEMAIPALKSLCLSLSSLNIWTRLPDIYPHAEVEEIIELMTSGLVLPYLAMPLQHIVGERLQAMRRPDQQTPVDVMLQRLATWREMMPDMAIRGSFVVGLPGETAADFQVLLDFLETARLDRLTVLPYSGMLSLEKNVPEAIKDERLQRVLTLQTQLSTEKLADKIGSIQPVIVDDIIEDDEVQNIALGRTVYDAPEIDGIVQIEDIYGAEPGQIVHVEIIDATEHDLIAVPA